MGADQHLRWKGQAASALDWWRDAGVDTLVEEAPRDWLARPVEPPPTPVETVPEVPASAMPGTLEAMLEWRMSEAAPDHRIGKLIAPTISPGARIACLIDMPDAEDTAEGRLVGGASGVLLDRMLAAIGLDRQQVHLIPLCAARPMTGRILPELEAPLAAVARHLIALTGATSILALGSVAARAIDKDADPRGGLRLVNHDAAQWRLIASFHPRFLLQRPAAKAESWKHLQLLKQGMD